jgi:hypothetical protein
MIYDKPLMYATAAALVLAVLLSCKQAYAEDERCGMLRSAQAAGMASQFPKAQVAAARAWYGRNCNSKRREASAAFRPVER